MTEFKNNTKFLDEVVDNFGKNIPNEISLALKEILDAKLQDINFSEDMDSKSSIENIIHDYMKKAAPTLKQLSTQIADILMSKLESEYASKKEGE
ncbi:MAG: hypothetical protein WCO66_01285 [Candidatus Absconditabacteria bacterium]